MKTEKPAWVWIKLTTYKRLLVWFCLRAAVWSAEEIY